MHFSMQLQLCEFSPTTPPDRAPPPAWSFGGAKTLRSFDERAFGDVVVVVVLHDEGALLCIAFALLVQLKRTLAASTNWAKPFTPPRCNNVVFGPILSSLAKVLDSSILAWSVRICYLMLHRPMNSRALSTQKLQLFKNCIFRLWTFTFPCSKTTSGSEKNGKPLDKSKFQILPRTDYKTKRISRDGFILILVALFLSIILAFWLL